VERNCWPIGREAACGECGERLRRVAPRPFFATKAARIISRRTRELLAVVVSPPGNHSNTQSIP
jgi:hypothetical protein